MKLKYCNILRLNSRTSNVILLDTSVHFSYLLCSLGLKKIPSPQTTAQKILDNFIKFHPSGKRQVITPEDIIYVMDRSRSVGSCEFNEGKKGLIRLIEICQNTGVSCVHAGITFASEAKRNFKFLPEAQAIQQMRAILN